MKKSLFLIMFLSIMPLSSIHAASSFSNSMLQKASEQAALRIGQKTSALTLDETTEKAVDQKKEQLLQTLHALDEALKNHDKVRIREQAVIFRNTYKETLILIQSAGTSKNAPETTGNMGNVPITYYSDGFEGMKTANGNPFSQYYFSAAACKTPLNTLLQVGKSDTSVIVKLNDRPNCAKYPDLVDLSKTAFVALGKSSSESGTVTVLGTVPKNYIKRPLQTDAFKDLWIALDDNLPNAYLKNETLHISGKELAGKEYTILYLRSPSGKDITLGTKTRANGRFEYDYPLEEKGTYEMVLSSGLGFKTSTFLNITVLDDAVFSAKKLAPVAKDPINLSKLDVERVELPDFTSLYLFRFPDDNFHTLTIKSSTDTFVYRGFRTIAIRSDTLKALGTEKSVSVQVDSQRSSTVFSHDTFTSPVVVFKKPMVLVPGYKAEQHDDISVTEKSGSVIVRGTISAAAKVRSDILVTLPDGDVEKYSFDPANIDSDGYLKRGKAFEKIIPLRQKGLHLVEVNYDNGFAAYNGPVTYGEVLPAYPNDYDGIQKEIGTVTSSAVAAESLVFVNKVRTKSGKSALSLDDDLNSLAMLKARDMAKSRNVSHTDSHGDKIGGTAKRNGIKIAGGIGENVAGGNVYFKTLLVGLANSGGHRANMQGDWKKIWVGYAVNDGVVYYVQVFGE